MSYTIRFLNYDRSDLLGTATVEAGEDATSKAPKPEDIKGKKFDKWSADITHVVEDMTVWPLYVTVYTVIFKSFDGTRNLSEQSVEEGKSATAPTPETIPHRTFEKWDKDFSKVYSDMTIHPVYKLNKYTVRFLDKDGEDVWSVQEIDYGKDAVPPAPRKYEGFIYIGWIGDYHNITENRTIRPLYRELPPSPRLDFYVKNPDDTSGALKKSYRGVNACRINQKLSGECNISFKLLTRQTDSIVSVNDVLEVEDLVFYVTEVKKNISSGICYTEMNGEHISYILNDEKYDVEAFDMQGTPQDILTVLLSDTPFTIGAIDFDYEVTLRVNKKATRRACVMQLIALVRGEIEYYGYSIGIRSHLGSPLAKDVMKECSVQDISYSYNVSDNTTNYTLSLYQKGHLEMGDELSLKFAPLGIETESRVVGMDWNPFNYREVSITVGQYIPTLNDSLYQLVNDVEDIRESTAKYTVEFGEMIGNGTFYFTRAYNDRPYFHIHTDDGSEGIVTLNRKDGSAFSSYVGATLTGVKSTTVTLLVFYCTVPDVEEEKD